ncbi:MAG: hypothetical protein QW575_06845 [Thermoproteota archaeon]
MPETITAPPPTSIFTTTAHTTASSMPSQQNPLLSLFLNPYIIFGIIIFAIAVIFILLYTIRKTRMKAEKELESFGGTLNINRALALKPDALALTMDLDTRNIYWVPLFYQGGYYTFKLKGRPGIFIPIKSAPMRVLEKPTYLAMRSGSVSLETDPELILKMNLASIGNKEIEEALRSSFLHGMKKLQELSIKISTEISERSGKISTAEEVLFDLSPTGIYESLVKYIGESIDSSINAMKGLSEILLETGGALEKKSTGGDQYSRWMIYGSIALMIALIGVAVYKLVLGGV